MADKKIKKLFSYIFIKATQWNEPNTFFQLLTLDLNSHFGDHTGSNSFTGLLVIFR